MGRNQGSEERGERKQKRWMHKRREKEESQKKGEKDEVRWRVKEDASRQGRAAELCPGNSWSPSPRKKGEENLYRDSFIQPPACEMGQQRAVYPGMSQRVDTSCHQLSEVETRPEIGLV